MATKAKAEVNLQHAPFPTGSRVGLYDRVGDVFAPTDSPVKTAAVRKDSSVKFEGLDEGSTFFVAAVVDGAWRSRAVTAKTRAPAKRRTERPQTANAQTVHQTPKGPGQLVTGARSTVDARVRGHQPPAQRFAIDGVGKPTPEGERPANPQPAPRLEDEPFDAVASDTVTGEAVPVAADEEIPKLPQHRVPKGTVQMSDTPLGEATIIPGEPLAQEEVPDSVVQRSSTESGSAEIEPGELERHEQRKKRSRRSARRRKSSTRSKAKKQAQRKPEGKPPAKATRGAKKSGGRKGGRK